MAQNVDKYCGYCKFYTFDSSCGLIGCSNPLNPDRDAVDEYGFFDCPYFVDYRSGEFLLDINDA